MQEMLIDILNVAKRHNPLENLLSLNIFILNNIKYQNIFKNLTKLNYRGKQHISINLKHAE